MTALPTTLPDATSLLGAEAPVVFFANGIGDAVMALPALRALSSLFPGRLKLISRAESYAPILRALPTKEQFYVGGGSKRDWRAEEIDDIAASVRHCDLFISLVPWKSPSLAYLVERLRPSVTLGFFPVYDVAVPRDYSKHSAELNFDAVRAISPACRFEDFLDPPAYPAKPVAVARDIKGGLDEGVRILALHAQTVAEKMVEPARLATALDAFLSAHPEFLVLQLAYRDDPLPLPGGANTERVISCAGLPLIDAMCVVHYSDYFLGVDSCMLHVADFGRVPSVGLFGPTSAHEFGFVVGPHVAVQARSDMSEIGADSIVAALEALLLNPRQRLTWHLPAPPPWSPAPLA